MIGGENKKLKFNIKSKHRAVSPVIATLLLIAIAVAAAIIVYAFVTGLIGSLSVGTNLVTSSSSITGSVIVISIDNHANNPIQSITVVSDNTVPLLAPIQNSMIYNGGLITALNPLPTGSSTSGSTAQAVCPNPPLSCTQYIAGDSYAYTINITFVGGSTQIIPLNIVAT